MQSIRNNAKSYNIIIYIFHYIIANEYKDNVELHLVPSAWQKTKVQAGRKKQMPSQPEQYGSTVHLFIGTGRSPCEITSMPFTIASDSKVNHRGLNSLFPFKSVPFSAVIPKLPCV
jgi:hypothetical protein